MYYPHISAFDYVHTRFTIFHESLRTSYKKSPPSQDPSLRTNSLEKPSPFTGPGTGPTRVFLRVGGTAAARVFKAVNIDAAYQIYATPQSCCFQPMYLPNNVTKASY